MTWVPEPPRFEEIWTKFTESHQVEDVVRLTGVGPLTEGHYRHWDKVRYLTPPSGLTPEEHWLGLKMARRQLHEFLPMVDHRGEPFRIASHSTMQKMLHLIDMRVGGAIGGSGMPDRPGFDLMLMRSLDEEGISSSQLEGATTTRRVAREMLRSGREPRSKSEQMILNNVEAMRLARDSCADPLTPGLIRTIHRLVTRETLPPEESGEYRRSDDDVQIFDEHDRLLFTPPDAGQVEERIERLCSFANRPEQSDPFVHPVVQSILLHFWLAYIHPFVDGNGRTARILFYWSMLRHGYWLTEYLSISRILKEKAGQYKRAFLRTESDENDLTYFVDHQLDVLLQAIDLLYRYIDERMSEQAEIRHLLELEQRRSDGLNARQLGLMRHALRHAGYTYTIAEHQGVHGIVYQTARTDLLDLVDRGMMVQQKVGRSYGFHVSEDLAHRMKREGE